MAKSFACACEGMFVKCGVSQDWDRVDTFSR